MNGYGEAQMARYVVERVLDGMLPEDAARDACEEYEVTGLERTMFVNSFELHSVRADLMPDRAAARVATRAVSCDPEWLDWMDAN